MKPVFSIPPILFLTIIFLSCSSTGNQPIVDYVEEKKMLVDKAEEMAASTFTAQLQQGAQMYQLKTGTQPSRFSDYVTAGAIAATDNYTVSVANLGRQGVCSVQSTTIDCSSAFKTISAKYHWQGPGSARAEINPK